MPQNDNNNSSCWAQPEKERNREREGEREGFTRGAGIFSALEVLEQNVAVV